MSSTNEAYEELDRPTPLIAEPSPVVARDRAALVRMDGASAGETFAIGKCGVKLGRGREADIVLDDEGVSRLHASIEYREGVGYVIVDLGSRNGTLVDGHLVTRRVLKDGDAIGLGPRGALRFAVVDEREEEVFRHLYESSTSDLLTGAANRRHFDERFQAEVAYAARHRTQLALLMFDIDYFKRVNDTHGHPAGDAVLRHVAALVTMRLRDEDVFARYGGEEFAVLLRNIDIEGAGRAAERLRSATSAARPVFQGAMIPVTISVGCATLGECGAPSCSQLLEIADRRLYLSKTRGRNRVTIAG